MLNKCRDHVVRYGALIFLCSATLSPATGYALEPKPEGKVAQWSGDNWGIIKALPAMVKYGKQVHMHAMVVGGPASDPFWSCSQYHGWLPNGTSTISITVPGPWEMPYTGYNISGGKVNILARDGGELPPYGWEERISDTCYCFVTYFGASGGCQSREVQPTLFRMMDQNNPREGNVQFATVQSGSGWTEVRAQFDGYVGVGWTDWAIEHVYVVTDETILKEDSDLDGLPDAWEYAFSPNGSLDDFNNVKSMNAKTMNPVQTSSSWINPYAPSLQGWVSAGPNDWDGDGFSNKEEYDKWNNDKSDSNGLPYSPVFINASKTFPWPMFMPAIQNPSQQ